MSLFTPNTDHIESFYEKSKFTLAWRICMLFGIIFIFLSIAFITASLKELLTYVFCTFISVVSLVYMERTKKSQFIYFFLSIIGTALAAYTMNTFLEIIHYGDVLWIILIVVFAFFGLGVKYGLVFLAANMCTIIYYSLFTVNVNVTEIIPLSFIGKISLAVEMIAAMLAISYVIYQFVIFHNYTYHELSTANDELQVQNTIISNQNLEKTTLVQEVHHRVKNNLQIIVSLLRLQKKEIKSDEAKIQFSEAINRIMVMSSIHQKLYKDKSFTQIVLKDYLTELTDDIVSLSASTEKVKITIESDIENIGLKTIVPLGLIVNELVSNSIQHGFAGNEKGTVDMVIESIDSGHFKLIYKDNGSWIEPDESYSSFGLELISILASQLEGSYERKNDDNGTGYYFNFKNLD